MNPTPFPLWIPFSPSLTSRKYQARGGFSGRESDSSAPLWRLRGDDERRGLPWPLFMVGLVSILLALGGGILYIRQITTTAASGYDISTLERRAEELRAEETKLQLEAAELQSLQRVEEQLPKLNLIPSEKLTYTTPLVGGSVTGQIPLGTARR